MKLTLHTFELPLVYEFRIARGGYSVQPTLVVELEQDGCRGYGEATTNSYYGRTLESMTRTLEQARAEIEVRELGDPAALWARLDPLCGDDRFALSAVDLAAYDLWGKLLGKPVFEAWNLSPAALPRSCITIGLDEPDVMAAKLRDFADWPIVKIKLGSSHDLEIVRRLRQDSEAVFRVDANCGWTAEQTIAYAPELRGLGVEFIEQPLPVERNDEMPRVAAASPLPIIADESCVLESDVAICHHLGFAGVNIKTVKCGGLTPARRMIEAARGRQMSVMVGCMTESTVGVSGAAQLLPLVDFADLDGPALIGQDIATGITLRRGAIEFARNEQGYAPGSGIELL
ncbi:MAG: dipeptide epimerase [Pirellulales bacterium]